MSRVLRKHCYAGIRAHRGEEVGPAVWEPLVDEEIWRSAQSILQDPTRRTPGGGKALLTGVARCQCGATVHAGGAASMQTYRIYRCSEGAGSGHLSRQAEPVDQFVEMVVKLRLAEPDIVHRLTAKPGVDVKQLVDQANAKRARLDDLAVEFADGDLTASQLKTATARLREQVAGLEQQIADSHGSDMLAQFLTADVDATWDVAEVAVKRAIISSLADITLLPPGRGKRTFDPESVVIRWR